jgi:hypothetical protein
MLLKLWGPLQHVITQSGITQAAPHATVLPEARQMLAQAARERPLANADFGKPFDTTAPAALPLGAEPLLPVAIDIGPGADGKGLNLRAREQDGRQLGLQLSDDLAVALMRLIDRALAEADWGHAPTAPPAEPEAPAPAVPRVLN